MDFTNTISWRETNHPHEWLDIRQNLTAWSEITGVLSTTQVDQLRLYLDQSDVSIESSIHQLKQTRELLFAIFNAEIEHHKIMDTPLEALSSLAKKALRNQTLRCTEEGYLWVWKGGLSPLDQVHYSIVQSSIALLTNGNLTRIKKCPGCQWLYYDQSKNGSRRWCTMEDCGNRHKVNQFNKNRRSKQ